MNKGAEACTDRQIEKTDTKRQTVKQVKTELWVPQTSTKKRRMGEKKNSQGNSVINYSEYVYMKPSSDQTKMKISLLFHHD